ncbi:MAG: T9SS type A sorting domain-containing protein [Bacteroidia bacterium]
MKKILCLILLLLPALLVKVYARNNFLGGDIEYKLTGKDTVKVTLKLYRNCVRTDTFPATYTCYIKKMSCNLAGTSAFTVTRVATRNLDVTCTSLGSRCDNSTSPFGVQLHQYEATIALNTIFSGGLDSNCCRLKVYFNECCRDSGITNMDPVVSPFYIETEFNRCLAPSNTSPKATQEPFFLLCNGMPFSYNHGFKDSIDYDSISSELFNPQTNETTLLNYQGSYNLQRPMQFLGFPNNTLPFPAGHFYENISGQGGFVSTAIQSPVMGYRINEWRKINGTYQLIGRTYRELIFTTIQCPPNNPPIIKVDNSSTGPFSFSVCAGSALCLDFVGLDRDSVLPMGPDTTVLRWDMSIPSATFTTLNTPAKIKREDEGRFCWTPQATHVSSLPYRFVVSASEDHCPIPTITKRVISIYVRGNVSHYVTKITKTSTNTFGLTAVKLNPQLPNATSFTWKVSSSPGAYKNPITYIGANATHKFDSAGKYVVRLSYQSADNIPCTYYYFDTINADCRISTRILPTTIKNGCKGDSIYFVQQDSAASGSVAYSWLATNVQTQQTTYFDTVNAGAAFATNANGNWKITAIAQDTVCAAEASLQLPVLNKPTAAFSATPLSGFSPLFTQFTNQSTGPFNKTLWGFGDTTNNPVWGYVPITYHSVWLKVINTDTAGNSCSDSLYKANYLRVKPRCYLKATINQRNIKQCARPGNLLFSATIDSAQGFPNYLWTVVYESTQQTATSTINGLFLSSNVAGSYKIKLQATDTVCSVLDSTTVLILPKPSIGFTADKISGNAPLTVNFSNQTTGALNYLWSFGTTTQNTFHTYTTAGTYSVWLKASAKDTLNFTCTDSLYKANYINVSPSGIENISALNVSIYPNPASNEISVECQQPLTSIDLIDITGREIVSLQTDADKQKHLIHCSDLPSGFYFIVLRSSTGEFYRSKILIQKY